MNLDLAETRTWIIFLSVFVVIGIGSVYVLANIPAPSAQTPTPTPLVLDFSAPSITPTPRATPTPTQIPTPTPTPIPTIVPLPTPGPRWCETNTATNETICHQGVMPTPTPTPIPATPTPEPTPSPTPAPGWIAAGMVCEVPDRLLNEPWIAAYKYPCTCALRAQYFPLAYDFSPFTGCQTIGAWRYASCECVEIICRSEPGLC